MGLIMEPKRWPKHLTWILLLFYTFHWSSTYSDVGKMGSSQNHFGSSVQSQFITKNNTRVIAQKGGLAILPCVVKVNSPATVSWIRRKDFQLLTVGLSTHSSDKRFLVEHTRHMGHWSLRIKAVREEDRGFYECQLSIYPTQSILIELKIVEAVAEISSAPDMHIDETSTLRLECKLKRATENPAFVFWYHDNKMVNYDTQGGFFVASIAASAQTASDNGKGVPIGLNGVASAFKTRTSATASSGGSSSSSNSIGSSSSSSNYTNGSSPTSTSATGHIAPITPSSPLPMQQQQQHQSSYLLTPSMSVLTIKQVHFHHAGNYTCAPSNARPASITVHVLRGERPAAMQHANRSILEGENANNSSFGLSISGTDKLHFSLSIPYYVLWCLVWLVAKLELVQGPCTLWPPFIFKLCDLHS